MSFYLAIVSPLDAPLYELQFQSFKPSSSSSIAGGSAGNGTASSFPSWSSFTSSTSTSNGTNEGDASVPASASASGSGSGLERHLAQMVAFAALDSVDEVIESTGSL